MFVDFRKLGQNSRLDTDICIIGAGAAGITIACELARTYRRVVLVESGDFEFDAATQALYQGEVVGEPYPALDTPRLRLFGGTTNHWAGHCRPLDPIDFQVRPWISHSGWPIDRPTLEPFYARAQKVCDLGPPNYVADEWPQLAEFLIPFQPTRLVNRMWQYSPPTRFGEKFREDLERSRSVSVLLNANAVEVVLAPSGAQVTGVRLKSLDGKEGVIRARQFVLACGGIENARLLLDSNGVERDGVGNRRGLVGRYFLEHPHAIVAYAIPETPIARYEAYYASVEVDGIPIQVKPGVSEIAQRELKILNGCIDLGYGFDRSPGYLGIYHIIRNVRRGRMPSDVDEAIWRVLMDLDGAGAGLYRELKGRKALWFGANFEQAPNPDSRVLLSAERDALGAHRVKLDWRLSHIDKRSVRVACKIVGEELGRLGLARMRLDDWFLANDTTWNDLEGHFHHMGTTRMSDDPSMGVVDRNCKVHGVPNLYIAGSSVFPTCGYANATLTIVALALRLADHLGDRS